MHAQILFDAPEAAFGREAVDLVEACAHLHPL